MKPIRQVLTRRGLLGVAVLAGLLPAAAQTPRAPEAKTQDLSGSQLELRGVQDTLDASEAQRRAIEAQIESLRSDRARLVSALLETTQRVEAAEHRISDAESRLDTLTGSEDAIRRSLESRRTVIAEVLASLQRMGRRPPPALLVAPQDMLQAIRTSMLLGSLLPEMRAETEALAADLTDLLSLRKSIAAERDGVARDMSALGEERQRLAALVDLRQSSLAKAEQALGAERERAQELARQAANLKDLITRLESEVAPSARGAQAARGSDADLGEGKTKPGVNLPRDAARLAPAMAFVDAKGLLPLPVAGTLLKSYGAPDGFGGAEKGLSIATRSGAVVASATDGWVVYAGPYRTYGQLLILNAGQGYYVVLAGMERINVDLGQFVLAGEPVAVMGDGSSKTAAAIAIGAAQPVLYVEFRKDGAAVDPGPWWAKPELQKVRG